MFKAGGYILQSCFGVELGFLGLDRFHNTLRPSGLNAAAEEEVLIDEEERETKRIDVTHMK